MLLSKDCFVDDHSSNMVRVEQSGLVTLSVSMSTNVLSTAYNCSVFNNKGTVTMGFVPRKL